MGVSMLYAMQCMYKEIIENHFCLFIITIIEGWFRQATVGMEMRIVAGTLCKIWFCAI